MAFNLRNNQALLRQMIAQLVLLNPALTDYNEGGVARSIEQSVANEIERLDVDLYNALNEAILTGTYKNFSFSRLPANFASGTVRVSAIVGTPQSIPIGTVFVVPASGLSYISNVGATLNPSPGYVDVSVQAQTLGAAGNTPANTIIQIGSVLTFSGTCTNLSPIMNGYDQETEAQRYQRFQNYIAGLSKGTAFALAAAAEEQYLTDVNGNITERCMYALIYEPWKFGGVIGNVYVFVDNGSATASPTLVSKIQDVEAGTPTTPGIIAAGVRIFTQAVVAYPINVTGQVYVLPGYDAATVIANVGTSISNYFQSLRAGDTLIRNEVIRAALDVAGTADFQLTQPIAPATPSSVNITPPLGNRITLGALTITQAFFPITVDP